jgi:predicted ArsR family transcriptional regulator
LGDRHRPVLTAQCGEPPGEGWGVNSVDELAAVALLAEPVRLELYRYVRRQDAPVGRAEAARAVGISVKLAAFHLDRLVEAEMLDIGYRRLTGRTGPGAGRPAKVYNVSQQRLAVSLPQTRYSLAAAIMASALSDAEDCSDGIDAVRRAAWSTGQRLGAEVRKVARTKGARSRALFGSLEQLGYEPQQGGSELSLRNCIFAELTQDHRELVCGMNAALMQGLLDGADLPDLRVEGRSSEQGCCACIVA